MGQQGRQAVYCSIDPAPAIIDLVGLVGRALHDVRHQGCTIDRQSHRPAHAGVQHRVLRHRLTLGIGRIGRLRAPGIGDEVHEAGRGALVDGEVRAGFQLLHVGGRHEVDDVDIAGA